MTLSPQKNLAFLLGALILVIGGGILVFAWRQTKNAPCADTETSAQEKAENPQSVLTGPVRYNCELSGGTFQGDRCVCPLDEGVPDQIQEGMYDKNTGFCQSTIGGPAGNAAEASIGLPYGDYAFWTQIVMSACRSSGGSISGAACVCPSDKIYNKTNGKCE